MTVIVGGTHGVTYPNGKNLPAASINSVYSPYMTVSGNNLKIAARTSIQGNLGVQTPQGIFTTVFMDIEYVVVGGGAGGISVPNYWSEGAGGGGAGGYVTGSQRVYNGSFNVVIGAGGSIGGSGGITTAFGLTANGGIGGTSGGASGGITGAASYSGQFGSGWGSGGGGGGAGGGGGGASYYWGGQGGAGVQWSGNGQYYAAGGGGGEGGKGGDQNGGPGQGGSGIGGRGGYAHDGVAASAPTANTGSGGGGCAGFAGETGNRRGEASAGASGVVVIKYAGTVIKASGGVITNNGTHTFHTFTSSGVFTIL